MIEVSAEARGACTGQTAVRRSRNRTKADRPFSLELLIEFEIGSNPDEHAADGLYERFGKGRQWWFRHRKTGLTLAEADELATSIWEHPSAIWPNYLDRRLKPKPRRAVA